MKKNGTAIVVTSINSPRRALFELALGSTLKNCDLIIIGDAKSPEDFRLEGCRFFNIDAQIKTGFRYAERCPTNHYARKNVGYLIAIRNGSSRILETDDDNVPTKEFFINRKRSVYTHVLEMAGWVNVYRYFTKSLIWPRGFPIDAINKPIVACEYLPLRQVDCPIQQGLADGDPDVDAIYRLIFRASIKFSMKNHIALGNGSLCPFNSQNTLWFREAFFLLYLPCYCSFRMSDIYRSFVAQRVAWTNNWYVLFRKATVYQERNEHNIINDFAQEIPGYLNNSKINEALQVLKLLPGSENIMQNMRICYERLVELEAVHEKELALLDIWFADIKETSFQKGKENAGAAVVLETGE